MLLKKQELGDPVNKPKVKSTWVNRLILKYKP